MPRFETTSAGVLALVGAILTIVSSLLQQRAEIPRGDPLGVLGHIEARPWFLVALVGVLGMLCWAMAFTVVGRTLQDPVGRAVARMAEPVLIAAVTLFAVTYAHDGFASGMIAQRWASGELDPAAARGDSRVVESLVGGTSMLSQAVLGLALALYAVAILRTGPHSRVLGWVGVVGTVGWFLGGSALVLQAPGVSFELLLPFVGLSTMWVVGLGLSLLRQRPSDALAESR